MIGLVRFIGSGLHNLAATRYNAADAAVGI